MDVRVTDRYHNRKQGVPDDFDWIAYRSLNADLAHIVSYKDAVKHYKIHGFRQSRPYTFQTKSTPPQQTPTMSQPLALPLPLPVPSLSDSILRREDQQISPDELPGLSETIMAHTNKMNGLPEDFDWLIYRSANPDLGELKCYSDAVKHYKEHGHREPRIYNKKGDKLSSPLGPPTVALSSPSASHSSPSDPHDDKITSSRPQVSLTSNEVPIPSDFDWLMYRTLNPDLTHLKSQSDALKHYREHGNKEDRPYKQTNDGLSITSAAHLEKIQTDYDWISFVPHKSVGHLIPADFDWIAYKTLNSDLYYIQSYQDAIKHYREHGYRESRLYKFGPQTPDDDKTSLSTEEHESSITTPSTIPLSAHGPVSAHVYVPPGPVPKLIDIPFDFNWLEYKQLHPDLKHLTNYHEAVQHYREHGHREKRVYKKHFDTLPIIHDKQSRMDQMVNQMKANASGATVIFAPKTSTGLIPNIIHFVYGFKKQTEPFELFKYLAIKSAIDVNHPETVYFHYAHEPFGPWWNTIKPLLTCQLMDPPKEVYGNPLTHYAHQSDVARLQILNTMGGIYLDIDTVCLRPLKEFLTHDFVMGIQGNNYGLCNAIMLCKPNTEFGLKWYEAYQSYNRKDWDYHSVILPYKLSKLHPITTLANNVWFYPLWDPIEHIVFNEQLDLNECHKIFKHSYCLHLWESWLLPCLKTIDEHTLYTSHTLYNLITRKFLHNTISIVMLTFNRSQKTIDCIQSFYPALTRDDIQEFIIFDNRSREDALLTFLDNLPSINPKFRVIHSRENLGVCGGRSILFEQAKGNLICSVDSDLSLLDTRFFDVVKEIMMDESVGMVGSCGAFFSKSFVFESHQDVIDADSQMKIDSLAGCCQVFRSDVKHFGVKLDLKYGKFWVEDADFCFQIRSLGKNLVLIPQKNLVEHVWGGSGRGFADLFRTNWSYFATKWGHRKDLCSLT